MTKKFHCLVIIFVLLFLIAYSSRSRIMNTSRSRKSLSDFLPTLAGIAYRRQALAKLGLLTFGFFFLRRITCLLLRAGTGRATAGEYNNNRWNQKHGGCQLFHRTTRIIKLMGGATLGPT
jgi:hypothetical protein